MKKIKLKYSMRMQGFVNSSLKKSTMLILAAKSVCLSFPQTHAEVTLAKADAALRQKEAELARVRAEHQALRAELTAVKQGLSTSTEKAEKLHEEGQVGIYDNRLSDIGCIAAGVDLSVRIHCLL